MGPRTRANLANRILSATAVIAFLIWGGWAIQFTQTSPGDNANIAHLADITPQIGLNLPGNATIAPGAEAQYVMTFETNIPPSVAPTSRDRPGGLGYTFGPDPFDTTSNTTFPHKTSYAMFTFLFGWQLGPNGGPIPSIWASTPSGIMYQPTILAPGYAGVDLYAKQAIASFNYHTGWSTWILEVDTPGNYTLHFLNSGIANAAGLVAMGYTYIVFSRSTPYLYVGIATIVVAASLGIGIGVEEWKKPRRPGRRQEMLRPSKDLPADALERRQK